MGTWFKKLHSYRVYMMSKVLCVDNNTNNHNTYLHNICNYNVKACFPTFPNDLYVVSEPPSMAYNFYLKDMNANSLNASIVFMNAVFHESRTICLAIFRRNTDGIFEVSSSSRVLWLSEGI